MYISVYYDIVTRPFFTQLHCLTINTLIIIFLLRWSGLFWFSLLPRTFFKTQVQIGGAENISLTLFGWLYYFKPYEGSPYYTPLIGRYYIKIVLVREGFCANFENHVSEWKTNFFLRTNSGFLRLFVEHISFNFKRKPITNYNII